MPQVKGLKELKLPVGNEYEVRLAQPAGRTRLRQPIFF
jgi:hypothetical protein